MYNNLLGVPVEDESNNQDSVMALLSNPLLTDVVVSSAQEELFHD